jgi:hypothetical protein
MRRLEDRAEWTALLESGSVEAHFIMLYRSPVSRSPVSISVASSAQFSAGSESEGSRMVAGLFVSLIRGNGRGRRQSGLVKQKAAPKHKTKIRAFFCHCGVFI